MKNLNPYSGLRQILIGYMCVQRKYVLDHVRNDGLTPIELGYFIIFLLSADWDKGPFRSSYIRHEIKKLSQIWKISEQTIRDNLDRLCKKGAILKKGNAYKIVDFNEFALLVAQRNAKTTYGNEELEKYFNNLFLKPEISLQNEPEKPSPFKISSKVSSNVFPKKVVIRQNIISVQEYQRTYDEGDWGELIPDDVRWIDENVKEIIEIKDEVAEKEIIEVYFANNWKEYKKHLIT